MKTTKMVRVKAACFLEGWNEMSIEDLLKEINANPHRTFDVKALCKHSRTIVDGGERRCAKCNDLIEITSYRD